MTSKKDDGFTQEGKNLWSGEMDKLPTSPSTFVPSLLGKESENKSPMEKVTGFS